MRHLHRPDQVERGLADAVSGGTERVPLRREDLRAPLLSSDDSQRKVNAMS